MDMPLEDFLEEFQDLLQRDDPVSGDTPLREIEEWDSLSKMACIAFFDKKFGIKLQYASFAKAASVFDIYALGAGAVAGVSG